MVTTQKSGRRLSFTFSRRVERYLNIATIIAVLLLVAVIVLWRVPSQYQIFLPATAESVSPKIFVAGHPPQSGRGDLYMTFVAEPDANLLEEIFARFDPDATLQPKPADFSPSKDQAANVQLMLGSEQTAELVALCHLGYADLCSGGLQVQTIESYSKAQGVLKANDIIIAVNGKQTLTSDELRSIISAQRPGAVLQLRVLRAGRAITVPVRTILSPQAPHHTLLGIAFMPTLATTFPSKLPVDVKIDPNGIGGPSAGLMFTLGLLNRLSPSDLTHGKLIAGTGTINLDGTVGAIGGIKQKVIGAQWAHAQYMFVPCDGGNYQDAQKTVGRSMTLVPVNTVDDALSFMKSLASATSLAAYKFVRCAAPQ